MTVLRNQIFGEAISRRGLLKRSLAIGAGAVAITALPLNFGKRGSHLTMPQFSNGAAASAMIATSAATNAAPLDTDLDILNYALTLEHLEAAAYQAVLDAGVLTGRELAYFQAFGDHERAHVDAITSTITKLGGTPVQAQTYNFSSVPTDAASIVKFFQGVEAVGASAYLGAAPSIMNSDVLAAALSIHAVEAEHSSALADIVAPGTDLFAPDAFAVPRTPAEVMAIVAPFFNQASSPPPSGAVFLPKAPKIDRPDSRYFDVTGHNLSGGFRAYWEKFGGLPIFGYPITEEMQVDGMTVQYFERTRFEWHPGMYPDRYDVLLQLLGSWSAQRQNLMGTTPFQSVAAKPGSVYFKETGHNVSNGFLRYWQAFGDLPVYGYPLSEEYVDAKTGLTVQYFQRQRFEWHPGVWPERFDVLLGLLGDEYLEYSRS
ncbi:MAG TPA: ferritin-like domain-containing protein [Nitrolancea sp.]|nr:ferritin-like domain-containing protein [Nitrolancea sp.]